MKADKYAVVIALAGIASGQFVPVAYAKTPDIMMQVCRVRAHEVLHVRMPDIETKYEGQRTDGTHAINGTAWMRGRTELSNVVLIAPAELLLISWSTNRITDRLLSPTSHRKNRRRGRKKYSSHPAPPAPNSKTH